MRTSLLHQSTAQTGKLIIRVPSTRSQGSKFKNPNQISFIHAKSDETKRLEKVSGCTPKHQLTFWIGSTPCHPPVPRKTTCESAASARAGGGTLRSTSLAPAGRFARLKTGRRRQWKGSKKLEKLGDTQGFSLLVATNTFALPATNMEPDKTGGCPGGRPCSLERDPTPVSGSTLIGGS